MITNFSSDSIQCLLKFKKLTKRAYEPTKATELSGGYNLYGAYHYLIFGGEKEMILTDLQIKVPDSCYGRIAPRSGLAWSYHLDVGAGVVDADYRGNIGVVLFNLSEISFIIKKGDCIAQLICERIFHPKIFEFVEDQELNNIKYGSLGLGSSGVELSQDDSTTDGVDLSQRHTQ